MAKTIESGASSYLSAAEALKRGDWRTFADLCSDDGARLTQAALLTDPNFAALLLDASGAVEQACVVGGRYHAADLVALAASSTVGRGGLLRLVYRLAVVMAYERRPSVEMKQPWIAEWVEDTLQALRDGILLFPFTESQEVGVMRERTETATDVEARNGATLQAGRLFGRRSNRNDPS